MSLRPDEGASTLDERVLIAPDEVLESERSSVITGPFSSTPAASAVHRIAGWVQPTFVSGSRWLAR